MNKMTKLALATSAAALFSTVAVPSAMAEEAPATVKCLGVNACKGQGKCHTATHACAGMNACKGQGWVPMTAEECKAKGGTEQK